MQRFASSRFPRALLVGILLLATVISAGCMPGRGVSTDPDPRTGAELRDAARRDLRIAGFFQAVSLGLFAWAIGNDSLGDGDQEIFVASGAVTGLLSFGALYNGVMNSLEAQQHAASRSDERLEEFAREATSQPQGR